MLFEFVDNANICSNSRKRIRSHVAKGKNVGKTLQRRKRSELMMRPSTRNVDGLCLMSCPSELTQSCWNDMVEGFSFHEWSLFGPELSRVVKFQDHIQTFLNIILSDEAFFHCVAAMSSAMKLMPNAKRDFAQEAHHLSCTFTLLNRKLAGDEALSHATLAVVLAMAQYERLLGQYYQGLIHFEGACRMVDLRGGIQQLMKEQAALARKVLRSDIEFALFLGVPVRFTILDTLQSEALGLFQTGMTQSRQRSFCNSTLFHELNLDLQMVMMDTMALAHLMNDTSSHRIRLEESTFHDALLLIGYRLARIKNLSDTHIETPVEHALHHSLVVFVSTFVLGLGRLVRDCTYLTEQARVVLQGYFGADLESQEVFIWLLFSVGVTLPLQFDDAWLALRLRHAQKFLSIDTWDGVAKLLSKFPWVGAVNDVRGEEFWNRLMESCHEDGVEMLDA